MAVRIRPKTTSGLPFCEASCSNALPANWTLSDDERAVTPALRPVESLGREFVALVLEVDDGVGDLAVLRPVMLPGTCRWTAFHSLRSFRYERRGDRPHGGYLLDLREHRVDGLSCDCDRAGLAWKTISSTSPDLLLNPYCSSESACVELVPGRREGVGVGGTEGLGEHVHAKEEDDPGAEHEPAAAIGKCGRGTS